MGHRQNFEFLLSRKNSLYKLNNLLQKEIEKQSAMIKKVTSVEYLRKTRNSNDDMAINLKSLSGKKNDIN